MTNEQFESLKTKCSQNVHLLEIKLAKAKKQLGVLETIEKEYGVECLNDRGCLSITLSELIDELSVAYGVTRKDIGIGGGLTATKVKDSKSKAFGRIELSVKKGDSQQEVAVFKVLADSEFVDGTTVEEVMINKNKKGTHSVMDLVVDVDLTQEYMQNPLFVKAVKNHLNKFHNMYGK